MADSVDVTNIKFGDRLDKPVEDKGLFQAVMQWVCDPTNNAILYEYADHYEIREKPAEQEQPEEETDYITVEERLDDIENALIELAEMLTSAE